MQSGTLMSGAVAAARFLGVGEKQVRTVVRWTLDHQPSAFSRQGAPVLGCGEVLIRAHYPATMAFQDWYRRQAAERLRVLVRQRGATKQMVQ